MEKESKRMDTDMGITESLCCAPNSQHIIVNQVNSNIKRILNLEKN